MTTQHLTLTTSKAAKTFTTKVQNTALGYHHATLIIAALTIGQARAAAWEWIRENTTGHDWQVRAEACDEWSSEAREAADQAAAAALCLDHPSDLWQTDTFREFGMESIADALMAAFELGRASK